RRHLNQARSDDEVRVRAARTADDSTVPPRVPPRQRVISAPPRTDRWRTGPAGSIAAGPRLRPAGPATPAPGPALAGRTRTRTRPGRTPAAARTRERVARSRSRAPVLAGAASAGDPA